MKNPDEQEIRHLMDEWRRLTSGGNVDGLLELTADDVVFLTPGNPPIGKDQFADGLRKVLAKARIEPAQDVLEIWASEDLAVAWSQLSVDLIPSSGEPLRNEGYALTVFRRSPAGRWQIARDANLMAGAGNRTACSRS